VTNQPTGFPAARSEPAVYSIAIFVHDIDRALAFYRDALGLPLGKQGSFGAEFFVEGTRVGVHPAVHPDARALVGRHTGITLYVPGLLHYCGELHQRGVRFLAEPTQQTWGIMAMVADPDGNVLALWEDQLPETTEYPPHVAPVEQADGAG
jgi:lactoylglutathione lyase